MNADYCNGFRGVEIRLWCPCGDGGKGLLLGGRIIDLYGESVIS